MTAFFPLSSIQKDNLMATNSGSVSDSTNEMRTKSMIDSPKRDDKHLRCFRMGVLPPTPPPPPPALSQLLHKAYFLVFVAERISN